MKTKLITIALLSTFLFCVSCEKDKEKVKVITHDIKTIQPSAADGIDAFVFDFSPDENYGTRPEFFASAWTNGGSPVLVRSLIKFNFSAIPEGAIIDSVKLSLFWYKSQHNTGHSTLDGSNACELKRVTSAWDENLVTWNNQPTTTNVGEVVLPESVSDTQNYLNIDVTNLAKGMIADSTTNFGFMLKLQTEEYYRSMLFASSDNDDPSVHPKLDVYYTLEEYK